ncbi:hypothetical protein AALA98_15615, partial [Lachnospiraceae bacterium 45-W7]
NEIGKFPVRLNAEKTRKTEILEQLANAKVEVEKPFAYEDELKEKTERLNKLNIELNLNEKDNTVIDDEPEQDGEPPEKKVRTGRGKIPFAHLYCGFLGSIIKGGKKKSEVRKNV